MIHLLEGFRCTREPQLLDNAVTLACLRLYHLDGLYSSSLEELRPSGSSHHVFCDTSERWGIVVCSARSLKVKKIKVLFLIEWLTHLLLFICVFIILFLFLLFKKWGYLVRLIHEVFDEEIVNELCNDISTLFNLSCKSFIITNRLINRALQIKFALYLNLDRVQKSIYKWNDSCLFVKVTVLIYVM